MKKILILLLLFSTILGCSSNSHNQKSANNVEKSFEEANSFFISKINNEINAKENIKKEYSQDSLISNTFCYKGQSDTTNYYLQYLIEKFDIEVIRTFRNGSLPYALFKVKEGGYYLVFFRYIQPNYYNNRDIYHYVIECAFIYKGNENYQSLEIGDTINDVAKIDVRFDTLLFFNSLRYDNVNNLFKSYHIGKKEEELGFYEICYIKNDVLSNESDNFIINEINFIPNGEYLMTILGKQQYYNDNNVNYKKIDVFERFTFIEEDLID